MWWPGSSVHSTLEEPFPGKGRRLSEEGTVDSGDHPQRILLSVGQMPPLGPSPLSLPSQPVASPLAVRGLQAS